jgi:hypothetical protein
MHGSPPAAGCGGRRAATCLSDRDFTAVAGGRSPRANARHSCETPADPLFWRLAFLGCGSTAVAERRLPIATTHCAGGFGFWSNIFVELSVGVKKSGKGRRKLGQKKRRMRAKIRHRKR